MATETVVILLLFGVLGVVVGQSGTVAVILHVDEELQGRNFLGNIAALSNLSAIMADINNVLYQILTNDYESYFEIDLNSDLYLVSSLDPRLDRSLDREAVCPNLRIPSDECAIDFVVGAVAGSDLEFINVHVVIEDRNDNPPWFSNAVFNITIQEGSVDVSYELPMASDLDKGQGHGIQRYLLEPNGTSFRLDVLQNSDGTSKVYLVMDMSLDRELWDNYQLYVKAVDGGNPALVGMLTINITVTDVNDNRPNFSESEYNITIDEDELVGTTILTVTASDRDIGSNARLSYYFTDAEPSSAILDAIGVNEATGEVSIIGDLPSETGPFILSMEAKDHGNPVKKSFPQARIIINVLDKNDNRPEIQITIFNNGRIKENSSIGRAVAHIRVADADKGENSIASCACDNNNFSILKLEPNVFKVVVSVALDYEIESSYLIVINCSDRGVPSLSSSENFTVIIEDVNDNPPIFANHEYVVNVTENNAPQYVMLKVVATDRDAGNNGRITYEIEQFAEQSKFQIDHNSGMIRVIEPLDRDAGRDVYKFNVTARDNGLPNFSDKTSIVVNVLDLNDNAPKFIGDSYAMSLPENQNMSASIGQVTASDPDAGDNGKVSYMIPAIYALFPFAVLDDGTVITTAKLDRENQSQYDFVILASDHGNPPNKSSIPVTVTVLDENDNEPVIIFPTSDNDSISVAHNTIPNTILITIVAEDYDGKVKNKKLLYHIDAGNDLDVFQIDEQTGDIFLRKQVFNGDIKAYTLTISVKDQGDPQLETRTTLHIKFYIANETEIAETSPGSKGQNILIAIIISCVTFVLSVIIIIVICVIRRNDRKSALYNNKAYDEQKIMSSDSHRNSNRSNSSKGSRDKMIYPDTNSYPENNYQIRKNKKEVSFSLEESDGTVEMQPNIGQYDPAETQLNVGQYNPAEMQRNVGQYDPVSTFRTPTPDNEQHYRQQTPPPKPERSNTDESQQRNIHRMASLRVHQALIQSNNNNNNKPWPPPPTTQEETSRCNKTSTYTGSTRSPLEDCHSESSAEITTSDSGRGGSEEDIRASMTTSHDTDDTRSPNTSTSHPFYTSESQQPSFSSFHGAGVHKTGPILSSFMQPSSHQTLHEESLKNSYPLNDLSKPRSSSVNRLSLDSSNFGPSPRNSMLQYPNSFGHKQSKIDSNPQLRGKKSNITFGHSFEDESMTARSQDDDDTTTSGSYTLNDINDDILTSDVTEMFYKPDTFV